MRRLLVIALCLAAAIARGQSNSEINAGLQFNFLSPGARSLGLGGAFAAVADDATAAYANPAGLVNILRPEASAEFRRWQFTGFSPLRGHGLGAPTNRGADTISGIENGKADTTTEGLSFASFVYPRHRWAFGFYRHDLANFETTQRNDGIFYTDPEDSRTTGRFFPTRSSLSLHISSIGGAASYRLNGSVSLGVAVARYGMSLSSSSVHYTYSGLSPATFSDVQNTDKESGDSSSVAAVGGVLWDIRDKVTLAAVYRQGPRFPIKLSSQTPQTTTSTCNGTFRVPDVIGFGATFRATPGLMFSTDINRVQYSDLLADFHVYDENNRCVQQPPNGPYTLHDGTEVHLGGQWLFTRDEGVFAEHPMIVTAGYWVDPPHSLEYRDRTVPDSILFARGRADRHYSVGVSVLARDKQQVSIGYDFSRRQRTLSISALSRFP